MKEFFKNITAFSLACLVLLSTMSFTINKHYCGYKLVSTSVVLKAETCGMEMQKNSINESCKILKKDCCKDESQLFEGQDNLKLNFSDLNLQQQVFITSFVYSYIDLIKEFDTNIFPFKEYSPPIVVKDIQLLDEVFLI